MQQYVICIRPDGRTEMYIKGIDPKDKSISVWPDQSEAKKFDTKQQAQETININYLKNCSVRQYKPAKVK